ncbi:MAG: chloride channel protein [Candidatus Heimdallarchaeaceae archaeon]
MKKKAINDKENKRFFRNFKEVFIKYWKYSKKWFPFAIITGIISGVVMGLFGSLVVNTQKWLSQISILISFPLTGALISLFLYFGFDEVRGAGISYILEHKNTGKKIPMRVIWSKFIASFLTLGVNAPAGREGPSVTIGAAMAYSLGEKMKFNQDDATHAITIGAAACTAAVFRSPLGGTVFASEVPYKHDLDETVFLPALLGSAISLLVSMAILTALNSHPVYLDIETAPVQLTIVNSLLFLLLGVISGISGIGFSLLYKSLTNLANRYIKWSYILPFIGMTITALIVFLFSLGLPEGLSLQGTGFQAINFLLEKGENIGFSILLLLFLGKIIVTSTCVGMGASGGVMGPSLVTGAVLGAVYSNYIAFIIVGMSAMHAATTKTPIASMLIVLEMLGFPSLVIPIILSNSAAFVVSMDFSLYTGQVQSKEVILRKKISNTDILEGIKVSEAMDTVFPKVKKNDLLKNTISLLYLHKVSAISVFDEEDNLVGIIASSDFSRGFSSNKKYVHEVMTENVITVKPNDTLRAVIAKLKDNNIEGMPVVSLKNNKKVIGFITFNDVVSRYNTALLKLESKRKITKEDLDDF